MIEHECRNCFKKMISQPDESKDKDGNITLVIDGYCSDCTDQDPLLGLMVVEVVKIFDKDHVHGFSQLA